jgi:hypothetical protein
MNRDKQIETIEDLSLVFEIRKAENKPSVSDMDVWVQIRMKCKLRAADALMDDNEYWYNFNINRVKIINEHIKTL